MKRNNIIGIIILLAALFPMAVKADDLTETIDSLVVMEDDLTGVNITSDYRGEVVDRIVSNYTTWETVELSGRLHTDLLPISVTLKVYMKKGEELMISGRVPLKGEVVRLELTQDHLLLVNKLKKVYAEESVDQLKNVYPGLYEDLQNLLLGRITVPMVGEFSAENESQTLIYLNEESDAVVEPEMIQQLGYSMQYTTDTAGELCNVSLYDSVDVRKFYIDYEWEKKGNYSISTSIPKKGNSIDLTINFDSPKWGLASMTAMSLTSKYTRVSLKDFLKSF